VASVPVIPGSYRGLVRDPIPGCRVIYVGSDARSRLGESVITKTTLFGSTGALAALGARTNKGDIIYILPGHTEDVSAADMGSAQGAASGFSIIGLGTGTLRPTFTWTAAAATWLLDTDGIELANCRLFLAGAHAAGSALTVAAPITVSGASCRIVGCQIWWGFDADQIVGDGITWSGDDGAFLNNWCFAVTAAVPSNTFLTLSGADRMVIDGNYIQGATDATTRGVIDTETTACTNLTISNNTIKNMLASSTIAVSLTSGDTGEAWSNRLFVNSGILPFTASELEWYNNYACNGEGEAGALVGTASA
jgi:hypothetical protein